MSTGLVLLDAWIAGLDEAALEAGIFHYDARGVAPQLGEGSPLALRREPGNPHDGNAVEILTEAGIKLGYVPRRMNAGIAHRLDAGFDLRCCVVSVDQDGDGLGIRFTIRSLTPGDTPDPA
ncbi:MAG: HIRAN domain-containing protein, partial [Lamprocystis purpurea]|nr:HIRAN domain-containing protein [Lamprocystis purpurea]